MKNNNRGFTMVELLTAVCILAIISVMLITFLSSGTIQYTKSGNNVAVQKEAQAALNQITEILIDATNGVTYSVNETLVDSDNNFIPATAETVTKKTVCVFNRVSDGASEYFMQSDIKWDAATKTILYSDYKLTEDPSGDYVGDPIETNVVLAENVESFSVDLRNIDKDNTVTVKMSFLVKGQSFTAEKTVTIRNHVVVNKGLDETFVGKNVVINASVEEVILNPSTVYVEQGSSFGGFQPTVVGDYNPSQEVEWEIVNVGDLSDPAGTAINSGGIIQISPNETCEVIKVKATSVASKNQAGGDASLYVYGTSDVYNKYIYTDSDSQKAITISEFKAGANLTATATLNVNGVNFEGTEDYSDRIDIEVYDGETKLSDSAVKVEALTKQDSLSVSEVSSYKLVVVGSEAYLNKPLTLKATIAGKGSTEAELEFKEATLHELRLEVMNETGQWDRYQNGEERKSKRGETIALRLVGIYKYDDDEVPAEIKTITSNSPEWNNIVWSMDYVSGTDDDWEQKITNNLNNAGTLSVSRIFSYLQKFSFAVTAQYGGKSAQVKIVLPIVSLQVLNQHADTQKQIGIIPKDGGNKYEAVLRFEVIGLVADGDTVKFTTSKSTSNKDGQIHVNEVSGKDEFTVWANKAGTHTLYFCLTGNNEITTSLNVSCNEANVDGVLAFVPSDNNNASFFVGPQKEYYDLYGNVFEYHSTDEEKIMEYNGVTYDYDEDEKKWVKR